MSVAPAHKEVFGRLYHSVWNDRRLEFIDKLIAKSHALSAPGVSGGSVGPTAYRQQVERYLAGFPDLKFTVDETVSEKDMLVVAWTITGTHRGEFHGILPTNKKISFSGITIHQIADGKILESTAQWDVLAFLQQLGIPTPLKSDELASSAR
jgi:steroid delta-isomerase-like uncharacterized protein